MIAYIRGNLTDINEKFAILETNNVGYEITISKNTYTKIKNYKTCCLYTYQQIKEDKHTLYGFISIEEKNCFLSLISVNGVGPSIAMSAMSYLSVHQIISAIIKEDTELIKSIKGIGNKAAKRIILELKDKLNKVIIDENIPPNNLEARSEAIAALVSLGITKNNAEQSVIRIIRESDNNLSIENIIKKALEKN